MKVPFALTVLISTFSSIPLYANPIDDLTVVALGVEAGRAVIKTPDGKMVVIEEGDQVPGSNAVVTDVLVDRLVVSEELATRPPRRETIWIYKAVDGRSRSQRLGRVSPGGLVPLKQQIQASEITTNTNQNQ